MTVKTHEDPHIRTETGRGRSRRRTHGWLCGVVIGLTVTGAPTAEAWCKGKARLGIRTMLRGEAVVIRRVVPGSVAEFAGLEPGWTIRAIDGDPIKTRNAVRRVLLEREPGLRLTFDLERGDRRKTITVDFEDGPEGTDSGQSDLVPLEEPAKGTSEPLGADATEKSPAYREPTARETTERETTEGDPTEERLTDEAANAEVREVAAPFEASASNDREVASENEPSLPPLATRENRKKVLILDISEVDAPPGLGRQTADAVARALTRRPEYQVATGDEIRSILEAVQLRSDVGCEADQECLAQITDQTQADYLVSGSVGRVGREVLLDLSVVDPKEATVVSRIASNASNPSVLVEQVPDLVAELFRYGSSGPRAVFQLPDRAKLSFGVFELEAAGVEEKIVKNLASVLSAEVKKIRGTKVITPNDVRAILSAEEIKQMVGGACDEACMVQIAGSLNVDYLVVGQVGRLEGTYVLSLQLVDPREVVVANRMSESFRGPEDELIRAVRHVGRRLLGVDTPAPGMLAVSGPIPEAEVFLESRSLGVTPLKLAEPVRSGRTSLLVRKSGYLDWQSDVFVQPSETTLVWADLREEPESWYEKWWVWTIVGAALAGGTTAAVIASRADPTTTDGVVTVP